MNARHMLASNWKSFLQFTPLALAMFGCALDAADEGPDSACVAQLACIDCHGSRDMHIGHPEDRVAQPGAGGSVEGPLDVARVPGDYNEGNLQARPETYGASAPVAEVEAPRALAATSMPCSPNLHTASDPDDISYDLDRATQYSGTEN